MTTTINASTSAGLVNTADTSGVLQLQTANTAALTITASQLVGIGTTSPVVKLNVVGSSNANNAGIAGGSYGIRFENGVTYSLTGSAISGVDNTFTTSFQPLTVNGSQLGFAISGTEAMRIDSSGNVGIGNNSPGFKLDVQRGSDGIVSYFRRSGGTVSPALYVTANETGNTVGFGTDYAGATSPAMTFTTGGSERMRIDSNGNLLVGKTSVGTTNTGFEVTPAGGGSGQPRISLTSSGTATSSKLVFLNNSGTYCGEIFTGAGTSTTYSNASDYRLKEDVQAMQGALSKVMSLKPVIYKWKSDGSFGEGFIAHELQEVVPLAVSRHKDAVDDDGNPAYQGVDPSKLVATLTAALQETKTLIDTQAATITALTARIVALESKA